jgi:hypothetical protein
MDQEDDAGFGPGALTSDTLGLYEDAVAFVDGRLVEAEARVAVMLGMQEEGAEPATKDEEGKAMEWHG